MYSVSSASSIPSSSFATTASSTNWAPQVSLDVDLGVRLVRLQRFVLRGEVGIEVEPVCRQLLRERLTAVADLVVDGPLGQRDLDLAEQRLEDLVAGLHALLEPLDAFEPRPQVGSQLVEGVELARRLGEVVVEGRAAASSGRCGP